MNGPVEISYCRNRAHRLGVLVWLRKRRADQEIRGPVGRRSANQDTRALGDREIRIPVGRISANQEIREKP